MLERLVDGLVQGDRVPWAIIAALWLITAGSVVLRRAAGRRRVAWTVVLLGLATATSAAALFLATAIALPRVRWREVQAPELAASTGDTWRRLRGPAVNVTVRGAPDVAVPTIDAADRWVLFGLLSGVAIEGFPPAVPSPIQPGAPRICRSDREECRAWPESWPPAARPLALDELVWSRRVKGEPTFHAVAYDTETGFFLRRVEVSASMAEGDPDRGEPFGAAAAGVPRGPIIELIGRLTTDPPRSGPTSLFVLRTITGGRLRTMRMVSLPAANGFSFHLQRADVSLVLGPRVLRWFARPVLFVTLAALPLGLLALAASRGLFAARLRRKGAARRELAREATIVPVVDGLGGPLTLGTLLEDAVAGGEVIPAGTVVTLAFGAKSAAPIRSRVWLELPATGGEAGAAVWRGEGGAARNVGALVPGDHAPFRTAAALWMNDYLGPATAFAAGLAVAAPAIVAMASLWGSR